ncbi:hypothetical protein [Polaromonas sp. JS666]|uniref:hypothetical protein n=1 Tax=Polaromonas sp. (strain JS666 / ATCC BAA-500) TaxID=296591 RepID=UPI0002DAF191|nr:hypothetical protein [Polaromonas sp. JS666]
MEDHLSLVPVFMTLTDGIAAFAPQGKAKPYGMGSLPARVRKKAVPKMLPYPAIQNEVPSGVWPFSVWTGPI